MSLFQAIALALELIGFGLKAYRYIRGQVEEAELEIDRMKLNATIEKLKSARTPEEKQDANKTIIRDVLARLRRN